MAGGFVPGWNRTPEDVRAEIRRLVAAGESWVSVAAATGVVVRTVARVVAEAGGMPARRVVSCSGRVEAAHREEISRGIRAGETNAAIAKRTGFHPSTIGREIARNGGREHYRAFEADRRAAERRERPKRTKFELHPELKAATELLLSELHLSPQQISKRLPLEFPDDNKMRVSHETIYASLFVQGRGGLNKLLVKCLRSGRARRRPQGRATRGSTIKGMVNISERPASAADRAVPGSWEGDLVMGSKESNSAVATLVERSSRLTLLVPLGRDLTAEHTRDCLATLIKTLPDQTFKTLTWDQGVEMARHREFTIDTGVQVYFCDPHSPWQRPTNENTNGLLRQYFPKGTDLGNVTQADCDAVAARLNNRPRKVLDYRTPLESFTGRHIALIG